MKQNKDNIWGKYLWQILIRVATILAAFFFPKVVLLLVIAFWFIVYVVSHN